MDAPAHDDGSNESLVNDQLRDNFLASANRNLIVGSLMVGGLSAYLWSEASHVGLIVWSSLVIIGLVPSVVMHRLKPAFHIFYRTSLATEVFTGIAWALGSVIAMPETTIGQAMMLMLLMGVLLSGASTVAHPGVFYAFHVPMAIVACIGFVRFGDWPIGPFVSFWVVGSLYVIASSYEARQTQANHVHANVDLASANQMLDALARTDKLTGLANRFDLVERLDAEIAQRCEQPGELPHRPITLAYLDIDRFKQINDEFGHHIGDRLLQLAAQRLEAAATENELVARLGGDELTILSTVDPHTLGTRAVACFDQPFSLDGRSLHVRCSVGVASADGDTSGEMLMREADAALYAAKESGGGHHQVFGPSLRLSDERRRTLESELHRALVNGEIVPWLQPVVDLHTGRIVGAEALARWVHPGGARSAASFIQSIQSIGMMGELTDQLMHAINEFQSSLERSGNRMIPIGVNVPSSELPRVVRHGTMYPLAIEITEDTAIEDIGSTRRYIDTAKHAGHRVWLDDFGTGFSSMSVAAQLPVNGLKIDREFVSGLTTSRAVNGVVAAVVELAKHLSLLIVAEGVEEFAQAQALRDYGVTMAQGYLWSPAVPMADFAKWLEVDHRFDVDQPESPSPAHVVPAVPTASDS